MRLAASRTFWTAGSSKPMRIAMMAMTTSSSIRVKPLRRTRMAVLLSRALRPRKNGDPAPAHFRARRDGKIEFVGPVFRHFLDDVGLLVKGGRDALLGDRPAGVGGVGAGVALAGRAVAGVDGHPVLARGEPLRLGDAVFPLDDLGPVAGGLAVQGGELDNAVLHRLALEGHLAA